MSAQHTPGPWRWELNEAHKSLHLVGGKPMFDLTIIQPVRWGMGSATLYIRDTAHDGMNILHRLHERRDWIAPFEGRAHHANWCANVTHPDMRLIAAAPELLDALKDCEARLALLTSSGRGKLLDAVAGEKARAALAKAAGESA